jgi:hypothetical protein
LEVLTERGDVLFLILKSYSFQELNFAADSIVNKSSVDSSSSDNDSDSDLTDTSELNWHNLLANKTVEVESHFSEWTVASHLSSLSRSLCRTA